MFLPKVIEQQISRLVSLAREFDSHAESNEFWLRLRSLVKRILSADMIGRDTLWNQFEDLYTASSCIITTALHSHDYDLSQKQAISAFADQWQWTRELLRAHLSPTRSFFRLAELKLARSYHLNTHDLQVLSSLCLLPEEIEEVFEFVGGVKLRSDEKRNRKWLSTSDCIYEQTWRDCRFTFFYKFREPIRLLRAERESSLRDMENIPYFS